MLDKQNQGPQCTACGSPMKLAAIEPGALGQDLRTFACPECKRVQRHVIESSVTEAWIAPKQDFATQASMKKSRASCLVEQEVAYTYS
jgi:hypothetical protein